MNLFARFKKDYFNYLISILLPAFIAGISVPVLKNLLGPEGYGHFSIYFNATLICTAITTGWITQSIYRFYPSIKNKNLFARLAISISIKSQLFFYLPIIFFVWYLRSDIILGFLVCGAIFMNSMQFAYISLAQSSFLSRKTIYSETIRSVSYIIIAISFILIASNLYLYILFTAIIISYLLSILYLRVQTRQFLSQNSIDKGESLTYKSLIKKFLIYGSPLSMWIVFSYLLSYIDKLLILKNLGPIAQGNYQAIFDLLFRGITVLISPVIISMLPLLTQAYERAEIAEIRYLMKKIILFEIGGFFLAALLYWWFGANLLFKILKIPDTGTYRLMAFIILAGTFLWQISMVIHQQYILKLKSRFLLLMIFLAFLIQASYYWVIADPKNPISYPLGYFFAALTYLFLISLLPVLNIVKSQLSRSKMS